MRKSVSSVLCPTILIAAMAGVAVSAHPHRQSAYPEPPEPPSTNSYRSSFQADEEQSASPSDSYDSDYETDDGWERSAAPVVAHTGNAGSCGGCSQCNSSNSCASCGCGCSTCRGNDEPYRLFGDCLCPGRGVVLGGWLAGSANVNGESPNSNFNGPVTFNDREEGQLNQLYTFIEKSADTGGCGWDLGGRVDALYGTDFRFTQARGLETRQDRGVKWNSGKYYGLALPQAYAEVAHNGLSVKLGHFYTIIGYEVVPAPDNFFLSHAYTMQYGEPFTHTGVLASKELSDCWTLSGGIHRGWDNWEGDELDRISYLGGITWTSPDENSSLAFAITAGDEAASVNLGGGGSGANVVANQIVMYSVVFSRQVNSWLQYVVQHDHGWSDVDNFSSLDSEWYGVNQYWIVQLTRCWSFGARFEWFRDDDGVRVAASGNNNSARFGQLNPASQGGFVGNFYELTAGLNYKPCSNFIVRPELRWDWFDADSSGTPQPFDDGNSDDQFIAALDAILIF